MALEKYNKMRNFKDTPEPKGALEKRSSKKGLSFVVQKHDASHLHYDFRIEIKGVMKSWALPKGPSLNPKDKRLAMMTEDHPISYNSFEGQIPEGNYGTGDVIVWDYGTYHSVNTTDRKKSEKEFIKGFEDGKLSFILNGKKLHGEFSLVKFKGGEKQWLLLKKDDVYASAEDITHDYTSALSDRILIGKREALATKIPAKNKSVPKLEPMLATLVAEPFDGKDWVFEIKWDGYRALSKIENGKADLYSRNLNSFNKSYPAIVNELKKIKENVLLDGEIIAYDKKGIASFQTLQNVNEAEGLEYVIFDILYLNGEDLTGKPLLERKKVLEALLQKYPGLTYSSHIEKKGKEFFKIAVKKNLEGIIAKRKDSIYLPGIRSKSWLKIKNVMTDEVVIAGFTKPRGSRSRFGALVLGQYVKKNSTRKFVFVGHTGTGFSEQILETLYKKMNPLIIKKSPFEGKVPVNSPITWIKPILVAEIKFTEKTKGGRMRHPVFIGLREDKEAPEVKPESKFSNLDKIYFPKKKITKGQVIEYYDKIADYILPYLKNRPESLLRHPDGVKKPGFFQKNITFPLPPFAETFSHYSDSNKEDINYLVCNNKETLLYMANLGCIEMNPWASRTDKSSHPDYLIMDIDPDKNPWSEIIKTAKVIHALSKKIGAPSYVKTSGKRGLHILIPLGAKYTYEQVRSFAEILANIVHRKFPDFTSLERSPSKRKGKIYIDYLQNSQGQTIAAPYSLRPTEDATVSTPLEWHELKKGFDPKKFTIETIFPRLKKKGDIWKDFFKSSVDLKKALDGLNKSLSKNSL